MTDHVPQVGACCLSGVAYPIGECVRRGELPHCEEQRCVWVRRTPIDLLGGHV